jgi:hypothetical protein
MYFFINKVRIGYVDMRSNCTDQAGWRSRVSTLGFRAAAIGQFDAATPGRPVIKATA